MKENFLKFKWSTIIFGFLIICNYCLIASEDDEKPWDPSSVLAFRNPPIPDEVDIIPNNSDFLHDDDENSPSLPTSSALQGSPSLDVTDRTLASTFTSGELPVNATSTSDELNRLQMTNVGLVLDANSQTSSSSFQVLPPAIPRSDESQLHRIIRASPEANCIKCCLSCHDNYCQSYTKKDFKDPAYAESREWLSNGFSTGVVISIVLTPVYHSLPFFLAYFSDQSRELAIASMAINSAYTLIYAGRAAIRPERPNRYLTALTIIGGAGGLTTSGFSAAYLMTTNNVWRLVNTGLNAGIGAVNLILLGLTVKPLFKKIWTNCFSSSQSQTS